MKRIPVGRPSCRSLEPDRGIRELLRVLQPTDFGPYAAGRLTAESVESHFKKEEQLVLDVVDALELLGSDADLAGASSANRDVMLQHAVGDPVLRSAILDGDARALHALLRAPKNVCCLINPGEEEDDEEDEEQDDEGEDDGDDGEDDTAPRKAPEPGRR